VNGDNCAIALDIPVMSRNCFYLNAKPCFDPVGAASP